MVAKEVQQTKGTEKESGAKVVVVVRLVIYHVSVIREKLSILPSKTL